MTLLSAAHAGVVVVSATNPTQKMDKETIGNIFLGKSPTFPNGETAVPVEQKEGADAREAFHKAITGKSNVQLKAFWSKIVFSGKGSPPKEVDAGEMKKLIAKNPNLVGYINDDEVDSSVKVIFNY